MATRVVTVDRNQKAGVLPILRGLQITFMNFVRSLFLRQASTVSLASAGRKTINPGMARSEARCSTG